MKFSKKLLSLLLCAVMVLGSVAIGGDGFAEVMDAFILKADAYSTGDYIYYGTYPQTDVTDSLGAVLNNQPGTWVSYNYYSGNGSDGSMKPSNYMRYKDVSYNGNKYRAVTFDTYRPYGTEGATSTSCETCQVDNGYYYGNVYWFKYEPIKWRVLDPSTGLIMCDTILDSQAYNNYTLFGGTEGSDWGDSAKTYYANNYSKSSIREWLNKDFYNTAFSLSQQSNILYTTLDNSAYSASCSAYDSESTTDKVFLLSYDDVLNSKYGFTTSARQLKGSDYAKSQGLYVYPSSGRSYDGCSYWRLRSPGCNSRSTCSVYYDGSVDDYLYTTGDTYLGVVPALRLQNLKSDYAGSEAETESQKDNSDKAGEQSEKTNTVYTKNVKNDSDTNPTTKTFPHSLEYYIQQKKSTEYNPELAELLMWFAHSSYIHSDKFEEKPEKLHIKRTYESFGFNVDDKSCYRNYNYFDENNNPISSDNEKYCGWSVGVKDIENDKKLVMITVRGTNGALGLNTLNMNNEWWGDFCVADAATFTGTRWHRNFNDCADKIYDSLKDFNIDVKSDEYIFCLTGHSKGAGVANLTSMLLDKNGVDKSRVYDYNFACPDVAVDYHASWSTGGNHDNIHNICNACDLVTYVPALLCDGLISTGAMNPLTHWGKYGISKWFSFDWNEIGYTNLMAFFANLVYGDNGGMPGTYISKAVASNKKRYNPHDPLVYLAYLSQKENIDKMKDRETASIKAGEAQAKIALEELNMAFFAVAPTGALAINELTNILVLYIQCPVDFTVTDLSGNVLAKCVNNKPEYFDIKDNYILFGIEGDRKSVLIANPEAVKINIVATDSGTMEFSAEHLGKVLTGKEDKNGVSYTNIALEKGKKMLFKFNDAEKLSNNIMYVVDDNENPIAVIDFDGKENNDTNAIEKAKKQTEAAAENSKKTIIIISAISALILLAAAAILIKIFKTDKAKAIPQEEVYTEPQEKYSSTTRIEFDETPKTKEPAGPTVRQAESEIKLSCVKCEAGGICSMCKSETEQLYSITASKNGRSQTVTVCRSCAEEIVSKYKKKILPDSSLLIWQPKTMIEFLFRTFVYKRLNDFIDSKGFEPISCHCTVFRCFSTVPS